MLVSIPYGKSNIVLNLPRKRVTAVIRPASSKKVREIQILRTALKNPLDSEPLAEFLNQDCLVVVNDASRSTPTAKILKALHFHLARIRASCVIATGTHRAPSKQELKRILGEHYPRFFNSIHIHDCHDNESLVYLGTTSRGTKVYVNRLLADTQRLLIIGSVEPHYFAGYTGGRKSLIPGLAGYITIEQNHSWALSSDSQPLHLEGNPVHDDLIEALTILGKKEIFSIQGVLDNQGKICAAYAGDLDASFRKAVNSANRVYVTAVKEPADVVVSVAARPLDASLYQAHKAIEHGKLALKKGGTIILVAACDEGIGPRHFYDMLATIKTKSDIPEFLKASKNSAYNLGLHKAVKIAELLGENEIWAMTEMPEETLQRIHFQPVHSLQESIENALKEHGSRAKIIVLTDGATCVPAMK